MIERGEEVSPAIVGPTIADGKALLASLHEKIVTAQIQQHVANIKPCPRCGKVFRTKGYYHSTLRSVYGSVDMRIRRLGACPCSGTLAQSFSTLFTNKSPITPELRYLTAKMAALLPFRKAADLPGELHAGLRAIQQQVAPHADHILDCFHISMRFKNLEQIAKGITAIADGGAHAHALAEIGRAKRRLWNSHTERAIVCLVDLGQWAQAKCFGHIHCLKEFATKLLDTIRYLELKADSMPDYGTRYRAGQRISTGFVESAVNEIIAKRMVKKQQMRWNRHTVQRFLDVRILCSMGLWKTHSVIATKALGPSLTRPSWLSRRDHPTTLHTLL